MRVYGAIRATPSLSITNSKVTHGSLAPHEGTLNVMDTDKLPRHTTHARLRERYLAWSCDPNVLGDDTLQRTRHLMDFFLISDQVFICG